MPCGINACLLTIKSNVRRFEERDQRPRSGGARRPLGVDMVVRAMISGDAKAWTSPRVTMRQDQYGGPQDDVEHFDRANVLVSDRIKAVKRDDCESEGAKPSPRSTKNRSAVPSHAAERDRVRIVRPRAPIWCSSTQSMTAYTEQHAMCPPSQRPVVVVVVVVVDLAREDDPEPESAFSPSAKSGIDLRSGAVLSTRSEARAHPKTRKSSAQSNY